MRGENPLTIHEISGALTPCDYRNDWASESAAATAAVKQAEVYKFNLRLKYVLSFIQCQCFDKRKGVF